MTIDLSPGVNFIESFMVDQCLITRDTSGVLDDALNLITGELERPVGDVITVYSGKCIIKTKLPRARPWETLVGEGQHEFKEFHIMIPSSISDVELGDIITPTVSANDPHLLTRKLRIMDISDGSLKTYRSLQAEEITYTVKPED